MHLHVSWSNGGWALDLFLERVTRVHHDVDVVVDRADQLALREQLSQIKSQTRLILHIFKILQFCIYFYTLYSCKIQLKGKCTTCICSILNQQY